MLRLRSDGTVIGFLIEYEKLGFIDAVADLAQRAGLELPREAQGSRDEGSADLHDLMSQAARFFEQNLADNPRGALSAGARHRRTDDGEFALGFAPDSLECAAQSVTVVRRTIGAAFCKRV